MRVPRYGSLLVGSVAAAFAALMASPLSAQEAAVITGRVTAQGGEALGGANVVVAKRFVIGVRRRGTTAPAVSMFSSWVSR